jgi:4-methylaminobutanoate oxidase (formaldehyde-forming)
MQTIRHQRATTVPVGGIPAHHPVVRVTDVSCYVRPEKGGYLYGFFEPHPTPIDLEHLPSTFRTADIEPPRATMDEARRRLSPIFPVLDEIEVAEFNQGITTFAPDGRYLIGPVPGVEGLFVASGCAALGIAGSAAVGRWLASWALEGRPDEALAEFSLGRFGEKASDRAWVERQAEEFYGGYYAIRPNS